MASLQDLFNLGAGVYGADRAEGAFDAARNDLTTGYAGAEQRVQDITRPYTDFGAGAAQKYSDLGTFDFNYNDYLTSDSYQWLQDEAMRGLMRQKAAGRQVGAGQTLADLQDRAAQIAGTAYGQEHARQLGEYEANKGYYGGAIDIGAKTAADVAQTLGDISIGRGGTLAGLTLNEAQNEARQIASMLSDRGVSAGGIDQVLSGIFGDNWDEDIGLFSGGGLDGTGDWGLLGDIGGFAGDTLDNILGGIGSFAWDTGGSIVKGLTDLFS